MWSESRWCSKKDWKIQVEMVWVCENNERKKFTRQLCKAKSIRPGHYSITNKNYLPAISCLIPPSSQSQSFSKWSQPLDSTVLKSIHCTPDTASLCPFSVVKGSCTEQVKCYVNQAYLTRSRNLIFSVYK